MSLMSKAVLFAWISLWFSVANAQNFEQLVISDAYMPAVPPVSRTAAVYLKLTNNSQTTFILTGVETSIAMHGMIHRSVESDGVAKMIHLSSIEINPDETIEFAPGGLHIMLMGLSKSSLPKKFNLQLNFKNHTRQQVEVSVHSRAND